MDETNATDQIAQLSHDPDLIFKLPKDMMMSKKTVHDGLHGTRPKEVSISISLEEGTDDQEAMYCIDMVEETMEDPLENPNWNELD